MRWRYADRRLAELERQVVFGSKPILGHNFAKPAIAAVAKQWCLATVDGIQVVDRSVPVQPVDVAPGYLMPILGKILLLLCR